MDNNLPLFDEAADATVQLAERCCDSCRTGGGAFNFNCPRCFARFLVTSPLHVKQCWLEIAAARYGAAYLAAVNAELNQRKL